MSRWPQICTSQSSGSILSLAQGTTVYMVPEGGMIGPNATEAQVQGRIRNAFTASNLYIYTTFTAGTNTIRTRKNGANGGQAISVTATGAQEDVSGTDSLANGDLFCYQAVISNSHGDSVSLLSASCLLDDGSANVCPMMATYSNGFFTGSPGLAVSGAWANEPSVNTAAALIVRNAFTVDYLRIYINTSGTANATFRIVINSLNGNGSLSAGSGVTGEVEDTTGTDTLAAGDRLWATKDTGANTGRTLKNLSCRLSGVSATVISCSYIDATLHGYGASVTAYSALAGGLALGTSTTEASVQTKARVADVWKNLQCNVITNSRSDATTVDFRKGATSPGGGPAISVAAAATGINEDLTGSYTSLTTDLINYRIATGGGTGTLTISTIGIQQGNPTAAADQPWTPWPQMAPIMAQ